MNNKTLIKNYGSYALVTGGSSGLGRETAIQLAQRGLNILLQGRDHERLMAVSERIESFGVQSIVITADLSDLEQVTKVLEMTDEYDVGCFVAAAGFGTSGNFLDIDLEDELSMLEVNCTTVLRMTRHFARRFEKQGRGGIILFGSLVGFQGTPYASNYAATKAYIQILGEGLNHELKSKGVDVLCVAPGPVSTGFGGRADMKMDNSADPAKLAPEIVNALGRKTTVRPGFLSKFLLFNMGMLPRWGRILVMSKVMGGMTAHNRS